ncbi:MAG: hypothetical protein Q4E50_03745, partial [Tissierellia bacterium]|nr:hypothetical protein [Tissierellia bacterium]
MQRFFKKLLSFTLALILVCGFIPLANSSAKDEEIIKNKYLDPRLESKLPLYGGYYRTWHDVTSSNGGVSNGGLVEMDKLPQGTDLVFIFDDWQDEASPFWTKLPEYVENLHNQGSLVIRTIGTEFLMGRTGLSKDKDKYPNNSEGWSRLAKDMVEKYVLDYNLDGLDLDVEGHNYNSPRFNENLHLVKEEEMQQIHGVYKELIKELKAHNKLVIYDTTLGAGEKLFQENYMDIDLVLVQAYGLAGEVGEPEYADGRFEDGIDDVWKDFSKYISSKKFMIGFSFYEENGSASGGRWFDVPTLEGKVEISNPVGLSYNREFVDGTIEDSRAGRYALWQPEGGLKGGLFSYAIERDGVGHPSKEISDRWAAAERAGETDMSPYRTSSDRKLPTEFNQSKSLIQMMEESRAYEEISLEDFPDQRFLELVKERVGKLKAEVARFNGQLVIDDPEIISLKGLEEFKNVEKISLKGLNKLETFSKDNLPESFHSKPNLEISGLEAIRQLDLSSINLSKLPFNDLEDLNKWRSIEKFDISNNKLDFSEASEDRPIFELLVNNNDLEDFIFDGQRPDSYYKKSLDTSELNISKSENMYDTRFHLEGFCTISGRQINSERDFDEFISERIFDKQYIDQDYKYEDFIAGKNYSDYKIEIRNSSQKILEGEQVPLSKDETYTVKYFTPSEALIHTLLIKVGEGKEVLTKLTVLNAYDDSGSVDAENIESAFDDDISLSSSFNSGWSAPSEDKPISIYFDLGVYKKLGALTLHQYSLLYGSTDSDISKAYLEYLEDSDFEVDKSLSYQEQVDSLRSQEWKMHAEINSLDEEKLVDKEFDLIQARYWRLRVVATKGGTMWDGIMLPELELFGVQVPEEPATVQLTFNLQGGLLKDSGENYIIEAKIGDEIEIPQGPEKEGYRFLYWKGSEYYPGDKYLVEGNHEFEAVYEKIEEVDPSEGQEPNEEVDP